MNSDEGLLTPRATYVQIIKRTLLLILVCLPLFFINIRGDIDWGDDNAQYLSQARNIVNGVPQGNTGYIYNSDCAVLGPPAYPVGFPLLLSPVCAFATDKLIVYIYVMTFFLLLFSGMALWYFIKHHNFITSLVLLIAIIYNPWTLSFKSEIMSEIPFAALLLLIYIVQGRIKSVWKLIIIGLLSGFLISIRTLGAVIPLAILIFSVIETFRYRKNKKNPNWKIWESVTVLFIAVGFYFILNNLIFKIPADPSKSYFAIFFSRGILDTITKNLSHYIYLFQSFFEPKNDKLFFLVLITKSLVFTFVLVAFINKMVKNTRLTEVIVIVYFLVLIIYPYTDSGYRFLFPLLPFFMHYLVEGFKKVNFGFFIRKPKWVLFLGLLIFVQYYSGIKEVVLNNGFVQEGPCTEDATTMFQYIKTNLPAHSVLAFNKPRAIAFFTSRKCIVLDNNPERYSFHKTDSIVKTVNIKYFILYNLKQDEPSNPYYGELSNTSTEKYLSETNDSIRRVWNNTRYSIFERYSMSENEF
jgi:hypothetical protein